MIRCHENALPLAGKNINGQEFHAVPLAVFDDRCRGVETHGPGVEQGAVKLYRVVTLHPCRTVGDEGKAGGMTFREAVLAETPDLVENPPGELRSNPLFHHTLDELLLVLVDTPGASPGRHIPSELIRLSGCVVRRNHGQAHDLLLKERDSQGPLEHRFEIRMGVFDTLFAVAPPQVGMHHATRDGSRANNTHLDHKVVEAAGFEAWKHGHLRPALDLKDSNRIAGAHHLEELGIVRRNRSHGNVQISMRFEQPECVVQMGEGTESQKIHLEEIHVLYIVLVPLNNGSIRHGGILNWYYGRHRLATQEKSPGMNREMSGEVDDFLGEGDEMRVDAVAGIQSSLPDIRGEIPSVAGKELGHPIELSGRHTQGLAHVPYGGFHAVAHKISHHSCPIPAVFPVYMLDHLLAPAVLDIQVDIGRLGSLTGEESLEEKLHAYGIDGRYAETVTHR